MSVQKQRSDDAPETRPDEDDAPSIPKDDAFHLLQNARRRAVLRYLTEHEGQERFRMRDVAEEVAAWEHDTTVRQLTSDERQRVYIALYQSHLPKLDDHGVIEYNQSRGVVEPTESLSILEPYLDAGLHAGSDEIPVEATDDQASHEQAAPRRSGLSATVGALLSGTSHDG